MASYRHPVTGRFIKEAEALDLGLVPQSVVISPITGHFLTKAERDQFQNVIVRSAYRDPKTGKMVKKAEGIRRKLKPETWYQSKVTGRVMTIREARVSREDQRFQELVAKGEMSPRQEEGIRSFIGQWTRATQAEKDLFLSDKPYLDRLIEWLEDHKIIAASVKTGMFENPIDDEEWQDWDFESWGNA